MEIKNTLQSMRSFKFLSSKKITDYRIVSVDYTTEYNGKSFTALKFAEENQIEGNENVHIFNGTFLQFKSAIHENPDLDWYHNKPIIHQISFMSKGFNHRQSNRRIGYFRRSRYRFKKNQNMRIFYEVV